MTFKKTLSAISVLFLTSLFFFQQHSFASDFVTANGRNLYVNGVPFKSIGVNKYNILTVGGNPYIGCGGRFTDSDLVTFFSELSKMGVTSLRFWLFQSFTQGGTNFTQFNYLLSLSSQYHVKLIPVFENQWKDCTQGGYKDGNWYQTGYKSAYGSYNLSLKDYIAKVVPVYKNNSQILAWQIMNEAESSNTSALYNFAKDVSQYIKSLDSNHLVSFGTVGSGQPGSSVYKAIHKLPTIDVLEYHDYNEETVAFPASLSRRTNDSISINKPLIIGEAGISLSKYTPMQRATYFDSKISAYFNHGGVLYMIWSYRDANLEDKSYDFNFTDPLVAIVQKHTATSQVSTPSLAIAAPTITTPTIATGTPQTVLGAEVVRSCGFNIFCYIVNIFSKLHI